MGRAAGPAAANSLAAYRSLDLPTRQREVYDAIVELWRQGWKPSNQDITSYLGRPINCIPGRRHKLVEAGCVIRGGDKEGPTGRRVSWWCPAPAAPQGDLFARVPQ